MNLSSLELVIIYMHTESLSVCMRMRSSYFYIRNKCKFMDKEHEPIKKDA